MTQAKQGQDFYYIGTSGWAYDDWKGRFYPAGLARKRWLEYYSSQFSTVEVNAPTTVLLRMVHTWAGKIRLHRVSDMC